MYLWNCINVTMVVFVYHIHNLKKEAPKNLKTKQRLPTKRWFCKTCWYYIPRKTAFTVLHFEIIIVSVASFWLTFFVLENLISIAMTSLSGMVHVHGTILTVILKKLDKVVSMDECTLHVVVLYYPKLLSILILKYAFVLFRFWFLRISFVLLYFVLFPFNFILKFYLFLTMAFFSKFFFSGLFIFFYRLLIIAENWSRVICRALCVVFTVHTYYISTI